MIRRLLAALLATTLSPLLTSCTNSSEGPIRAALEASAAARILAIPATSPEKYQALVAKAMIDKKGWQNPYLIIKTGGVALLDPDNHEERLLKPAELTQALGQPASIRMALRTRGRRDRKYV